MLGNIEQRHITEGEQATKSLMNELGNQGLDQALLKLFAHNTKENNLVLEGFLGAIDKVGKEKVTPAPEMRAYATEVINELIVIAQQKGLNKKRIEQSQKLIEEPIEQAKPVVVRRREINLTAVSAATQGIGASSVIVDPVVNAYYKKEELLDKLR